jgi:hypothetical protein
VRPGFFSSSSALGTALLMAMPPVFDTTRRRHTYAVRDHFRLNRSSSRFDARFSEEQIPSFQRSCLVQLKPARSY